MNLIHPKVQIDLIILSCNIHLKAPYVLDFHQQVNQLASPNQFRQLLPRLGCVLCL